MDTIKRDKAPKWQNSTLEQDNLTFKDREEISELESEVIHKTKLLMACLEMSNM